VSKDPEVKINYIGATCPYCQDLIKPGKEIIVCDRCGTPHHVECWNANGGCTTVGCGSKSGKRIIVGE